MKSRLRRHESDEEVSGGEKGRQESEEEGINEVPGTAVNVNAMSPIADCIRLYCVNAWTRCKHETSAPIYSRKGYVSIISGHTPTAVPTSEGVLPLSAATGLQFVRGKDITTDTMPARGDDDGLVHIDFGEYYPACAMNAIPINPSRIRGEIVHVDPLCGDTDDASVKLS